MRSALSSATAALLRLQRRAACSGGRLSVCTRAGVSRLLDRRDIDFVLFQLLPGRASCHDEPKARERGASRRWKRATEGQGLSPSGKEGEEECKGDGDDSARVDDDREHAVAEARAVLDSAESFVAEWAHVDPLLDREPPILRPAEESEDGRPTVAVHPLTRGLYDAFCERGFGQMAELGLSFPVQCAVNFILGGAFSSNPIGFAVLTRCAADLLEAHGSDALKRQYLAAMRAGDVIGTMALSEPHAGSSLAAIRTTARKRETPLLGAELGEEWSIRGDKMWTSGAFHDVRGNTLHMLLARIDSPETPPGARGISLFLVPNVLPSGQKNDVEVVSLNKKMGHRALPNCAWSLGSNTGGAVGYLVGKPHEGLQAMFLMMNAMRIEVGLSAAALGKRGFNESLLYAEEREQGGKRIIEYADVKRMLLQQKAYSEGGFALCMHASSLHERKMGGDAAAGATLDAMVEIVKSWPSEWCLEANKLAIQVLGGAGYVRDYPAEQLYRDNRLNMIHEGTAGIHALTLLGRKAPRGAAAMLTALVRESAQAAAAEAQRLDTLGSSAAAEGASVLAEGAAALHETADRADQVTAFLTRALVKGDAAPEGPSASVALSYAHDYLTMMGHMLVGSEWVRLATAAAPEHAAAKGTDGFYAGKLHTARYFLRHELPKTEGLARVMLSSDDTVDEMRSEWF